MTKDNLERAQELVHKEYLQIHRDWFADHGGVSPADLRIEESGSASGYLPDHNEILLCLPDVDLLEMFNSLPSAPIPKKEDYGRQWLAWYRELVHEMLHEFAHKVVADQITDEGQLLFEAHSKRFDGPGHGAEFFTAIAHRANYFELSHEELLRQI